MNSRYWIVVGLLTMGCNDTSPKCEDVSQPEVAENAAVSPKCLEDGKPEVAEAPAQPSAEPETKPAPEAAPADAADTADAKLEEARRTQYKDPAGAYALAKESYDLDPKAAALWVMGPAACRLKDAPKALWAHERLSDVDKPKLVDICAHKGLELKPDPA